MGNKIPGVKNQLVKLLSEQTAPEPLILLVGRNLKTVKQLVAH